MPGMLPVINRGAVEYAIRVALALNCTIQAHNVFARKNYFYPDLPKNYQISQYKLPLSRDGWLDIMLESGETKRIRIRRVHMEEDTGKLTHLGDGRSLVDFNRSGVPLLEIVSEPDIRSGDEARAYAMKVRQILRYLDVNSGDMEKGVLRVEPNISLRMNGSAAFGTRTELKNLNSFRALADGTDYELARQAAVLNGGGQVVQETRGWHEGRRETVSQRVKEEAEDYRYFPEPDLPPLYVDEPWIEAVRASLPELPDAKIARYRDTYGLPAYDTTVLAEDRAVGEWFDQAATASVGAAVDPKMIANWIINELFRLMNDRGQGIEQVKVTPDSLVELLLLLRKQTINSNTAKEVLAEMFTSGRSATTIVEESGLAQISDEGRLATLVTQLLAENPEQVAAYRAGKTQLRAWFVGQVMRATRGKGNPALVNELVDREIERLRD
jgi:aspartyl-tRNA(Asn)/glutamyl-tRNA(Gln) amidotransferase subunit B